MTTSISGEYMPVLSLGTTADGVRNHALCDGPTVVAKVLGNGYPVTVGWSAETEAFAARLVACWNFCNGMSYAELTTADSSLVECDAASPA